MKAEEVQPQDIWHNCDNLQRFLILAAFMPDTTTLGTLNALALLAWNEQPTEVKIAVHSVLLDERKKG